MCGDERPTDPAPKLPVLGRGGERRAQAPGDLLFSRSPWLHQNLVIMQNEAPQTFPLIKSSPPNIGDIRQMREALQWSTITCRPELPTFTRPLPWNRRILDHRHHSGPLVSMLFHRIRPGKSYPSVSNSHIT